MKQALSLSRIRRAVTATAVFTLAVGFCLGVSAPAQAGVINYYVVTITGTSDLVTASANGTYASYFATTNAMGVANNNSIFADSFNFGTGGPTSPIVSDSTGPDATGDYSAGIMVSNADPFGSEYSQEFNPGTNPGSQLSFNLAFNVDDPSAGDSFAFGFYQNYDNGTPGTANPGNNVPTTSLYYDLFTIDFDSLTNPTVTTFEGDPFSPYSNLTASVVAVSPAPEPGTWAMMAMGLVGMIFFAWRRKRDAARSLPLSAPSQSCA